MQKNQTFDAWEMAIILKVEKDLNVSNSDASGIVDAQSFLTAQSWGKGLSAEQTADLIIYA